MSRPLRIEFSGAVHHVTSRGDRREPIYRDDEDRNTHLGVIDYAMDRLDGQVLAYCQDGQSLSFGAAQRQANLSRLMRHVSGVCTQAFNRGHGLVGHLFQGRFKAILVDRDAYLLALCRHVERNPVAAGTGFRAPSLWDVNSPPTFTNTTNSLVDLDCPAGFAGDPRCETQSPAGRARTARTARMSATWARRVTVPRCSRCRAGSTRSCLTGPVAQRPATSFSRTACRWAQPWVVEQNLQIRCARDGRGRHRLQHGRHQPSGYLGGARRRWAVID